jgi:release factor glutamine methyltransferase
LTVGEVLKASTEFLAAKGVPSPRVDAEHLVARALGVSRLDLYLQHDRPLNEDELAAARELVRRRGAREPLAYVLGDWGFRRLVLTTDRRALVPRPETEIVVERCLVRLEGLEAPRVLDVGTGSGAIALAIADECPRAEVVGVDVSGDALGLARENAERTGLARVAFIDHDLREDLLGTGWDLIVSNPPYVLPAEIDTLEAEVRDWEPRAALVGEGLTESIVRDAPASLRAGGWLVLEVGDGTADAVAGLLDAAGFRDVTRTPDLAGRDRVVEGQWAP